MQSLGRRVRDARRRLELSQAGLAKRLRISQSLISQIENDNIHHASERTVRALCTGVGVELTPSDLLAAAETGEPDGPAALTPGISSAFCPSARCPRALPRENADGRFLAPFSVQIASPDLEYVCPHCNSSLTNICRVCEARGINGAWCPNGHAVVSLDGIDDQLWEAMRSGNETFVRALLLDAGMRIRPLQAGLPEQNSASVEGHPAKS